MQKTFKKIELENYKPTDFSIDSCEILFKIKKLKTVVETKIFFSTITFKKDLVLDGTNLILKWVKIDNQYISLDLLTQEEHSLTIPNHFINQETFIFECQTQINPKANQTLEGLYYSSEIYCTQCEAEGFRRITYFLDRPDVLATYKVRIEAKEPILLSNGNLVKMGRGYAEWFDPWPKPSYLFALVAGDLEKLEDHFVTRSGKKIKLQIFVKPGETKRCEFAMKSLKRAMQWDEEVYLREYDLELFMIVAIDDFNMGAMENKGLNVFNSKYILADENTATDADYENIERIIAHEYFHNWTGNRITCRDWFQLCLKEGLTVFRDQEFTASIRNSQLERIKAVKTLQRRQFPEDDGPLSHPVRPDEYLEINNFYTSTVYEKGAELVRMLKLVVGANNYQKSVQEFFTRFDGTAATVEDWLGTFEDVCEIDLKQFFLWYTEKGRPKVLVEETFVEKIYTLKFTQLSPTNNELGDRPFKIPIVMGLLTKAGEEILENHLFILETHQASFVTEGFDTKPVASVLRSLSAPVTLTFEQSDTELMTIAKHDSDAFNRLTAIEKIYLQNIEILISGNETVSPTIINMFLDLLREEELDPGLKSLFLMVPHYSTIMEHLCQKHRNIDPDLIIRNTDKLSRCLANHAADSLKKLYYSIETYDLCSPHREQAATRNLKLTLLNLLCYVDPTATNTKKMFDNASNMSEEIGSLSILIRHNNASEEIRKFYRKWRKDRLVVDKWFSAQAIHTSADLAARTVKMLSNHEDFNWENPNRFNSLILSFASNNLGGFHTRGGEGYDLVCHWIAKTDAHNPQVAARLASTFEKLRIFDKSRQAKIEKNLNDLINRNNISKNTFEITSKILNS